VPKDFGAEEGGLGAGKIAHLHSLSFNKVAYARKRSCA